MTFENNNLTPAEQKEMELREKERAALIADEPVYTSLGSIEIEGNRVLLLVGKDHKWYKAPYLKDIQLIPQRNSPFIPIFDMENISPITEKEFYTYFKRS